MSEAMNQTASEAVPVDVPEVLNTLKDVKFSFKKLTMKNEKGEDVKRPPITLSLPIPTWDGLIKELAGDAKVRQMFLDAAEDVVKDRVRKLLIDEDKPVMKQEDLNLEQLSLSFIANLPRAERAGSDIDKETWEAFEADYIETMVPIRNDEKRVTTAAKIFVGKLNQVKTDKTAIGFLQQQLGIWAENTKKLEDFQEVFSYLDGRATALLQKESTVTTDDL